MSTTADRIGAAFPDEPAEDECKITVADKAPFDRSSQYWKEYARTCKIVASHPEGVVLNQIVAELHGRDEVESGSTEYQRTRRFLNRNPTFFEVRKSNGLIFVSPTLELLDLINGGIIQNPAEEPATGGTRFCENVLKSVKEINEKGERLLEYNLKEYVDRINDLRLILHSESADPEYLSLPYKTRFNDEGRINKQWSIMSSAIEKAGEWFDHAALLTLTTDPKKFDSLYEMIDDINSNWNRLMSWLSSDCRLGYRPEYLKVLEFTEKGYPHIHAIVFLEDESTRDDGMPWLESKSEISRYWAKYQGEIVDVQPLVWEDDLGDHYDEDQGWVRWDEDGDHGGTLGDNDEGGHQTAGAYLGKYLSAVYGGIKSINEPEIMTDGGTDDPTAEVSEKYEEKAATWKLAVYWATGRKIRTESRELRQAVEEEMEDDEENERGELAEIIRECEYEFVGAYSYDQIPQHIRRGLTAVDALMETLEDVPDNSGVVIGGRKTPTPRSLSDQLEGSGMLFHKDEIEEIEEIEEISSGESDGPSAADFM